MKKNSLQGLQQLLNFRLVCLVIPLLSVLALTGISHLAVDDNLQNIIKTSDAAFERYLTFDRYFPQEQREVQIIIQGDLLTQSALTALQKIAIDIYADSTVENTLTFMSAPRMRALVQEVLADKPDALNELQMKLSDPRYLPSRLWSSTADATALIVLLRKEAISTPGKMVESVTAISNTLDKSIGGSSLTYHLSGLPVLRLSLHQQIRRDQLMFGTIGMVLAGLAAAILFRSWKTVLIALFGPSVGVLWTCGLMGYTGVEINVLTQLVAVLVLVIGLTNSVHLIKHLGHRSHQDLPVPEAISSTLKTVGSACMLASVTTSAGFFSLTLSNSVLLRQFGWTAGIGSLVGFAAVILTLPVIAPLLVKVPQSTRTLVLSGRFQSLLSRLERHDRTVINVVLVMVLFGAAAAAKIRTDYDVGENLPTHNKVLQAMSIADSKLDGSLPLHVMMTWNNPTSITVTRQVKQIRQVQAALQSDSSTDWISVADILRLSRGIGTVGKLAMLPEYAISPLFNRTVHAALISTQLRSSPTTDVYNSLKIIDTALIPVRANLPNIEITATGFQAVISNSMQSMLSDLTLSLLVALSTIGALATWMFRSVRTGLLCIAPNVLPLVAAAGLLVLFGEPLRYVTVMVFSVCLGLSIDDTIHFLVRYRQHKAAGGTSSLAAEHSLNEIGGVLIITTLIFLSAFVSLVFSDTPALVSTGILACVTLSIALLSNLILLPALLRKLDS